MAELTLQTPVQYVRRVGPVRAEQLAQLGIQTVEDLLLYFPRRHDLRRGGQPIVTLRGDEPNATVVGQVTATEVKTFGPRPWFQCTLDDGTASINARWFHAVYLASQVRTGMTVAVSGKVSRYREYPQLVNPRLHVLWDTSGERIQQDELLPVYPAGGKLNSSTIAQIIQQVLPETGDLLPRWFDEAYLKERDLLPRPAAVAAMHRPENSEQWEQARRRLAYDECLLMQLGIGILRARSRFRPAWPLPSTDEIDQRIRARFPFALTDAQDKAVREITADLAGSRPMNRLLQGDVGSGKTVVALYACLLAVANRRQAAIMAPTEILATQHYQKIQQYLEGSRVRTALLVGGLTPARRAAVTTALAAGEIDLAVGTHALVSETVRFARLGLVVVDEQHKFGVRQRTSFRGKGHAPHYLVMTATPIPRTLAMTVFGDLDVTIIDQLPPGRGKTTTHCVPAEKLPEVHAAVEQLLAAGQQAYFIYPLVTPSPELELQAAEEAAKDLAAGPLGRFGVALVHGQMTQAAKDAAMDRFRSGEAKVLAASVVVEVGVDVPAANVMVVLHAERFGLAQLHQLRGRIGRSGSDAVCYLVASPRNPVAQKRLEVLEQTRDGFRIAEEDLRLRGPGEFFGTRQHGLPELKVADLIEDYDLLRMARRDAMAIIADDPALEAPHHHQLRREMLRAYAGRLTLLDGA